MIRKIATSDEWAQVRRICCETGKSGAPIEKDRWDFFGENWVGPYQKLLPDWTWVVTVQRENEEIIGYLTGCPDSKALEKRRRLRFDLPLLIEILRKKYPMNADVKRFLKRLFHLEPSPERCFPENVHSMLATLYPAHLHINLTEQSRGAGTGRSLVHAYFDALRERRVCGVHVFCGNAPVPFYEKLGFHALHTIDYRGVKVHCMAIAL